MMGTLGGRRYCIFGNPGFVLRACHREDLFKDRWFMFETGLVALMILETWVMASVVLTVAALSGNSSGVGVSGSQGRQWNPLKA
eukprot:5854331-Amphidinium_carterae.1